MTSLSRRHVFLGAVGLPAAALLLRSPIAWAEATPDALRELATHPPDASDESFWLAVREAFTLDPKILNLNSGGVSPAPRTVQAAMRRNLEASNTASAWVLWGVLEPKRENVRKRLAQRWGVSPDEVAITRNASEGLQILQLGLDLRPGDEVVATTQCYPRMLTTFTQRERRDGIVLKTVKLPVPCDDDDVIVARYAEAITPRTRLMLVTQVINLTGQLTPVARLCELGRRRGIPVIVDGAHGFAHLDFTLPDLECDYYATSLHKWLFAPHGTGMLYVKRDRVASLWPMMAAPCEMDDDVRKFEEIGTHPAANALAIDEALAFHETLGSARKLARLRALRETWTSRLLQNDRVSLHSTHVPERSCGLATFEVAGLDPVKLNAWLWDRHRILTTVIVHDEFQGIRVTPSVFTTPADLDRFCSAVEHAIACGLS